MFKFNGLDSIKRASFPVEESNYIGFSPGFLDGAVHGNLASFQPRHQDFDDQVDPLDLKLEDDAGRSSILHTKGT